MSESEISETKCIRGSFGTNAVDKGYKNCGFFRDRNLHVTVLPYPARYFRPIITLLHEYAKRFESPSVRRRRLLIPGSVTSEAEKALLRVAICRRVPRV